MTDQPVYDAVVVGLGGMGSAALYHLARPGRRILGLEQFEIPHELGSSHGETRIIRLAYFEHPNYVPLLRRAYELWDELASETGEALLIRNGSLDMSPEGGGVFDESLLSCERHDLPHEVLDAGDVCARYPGFRLPEGVRAVFQPDGGFLLPERCITAHVEGAVKRGAEVRTSTKVLGWERAGGLVQVRLEDRTLRSERLVVTTGPWASELLPLAHLTTPERQVLLWTRPIDPQLFAPERFPVFNLRIEGGHYYGFPVHGRPGVKVGRYHHRYEEVHPDDVQRSVEAEDEEVLRSFLADILPSANGAVLASKVCLFTNTPDEHFILDALPGTDSQVVVGVGFSGHGFKFASVIGELLAQKALGERGSLTTDFLALGRFAPLSKP